MHLVGLALITPIAHNMIVSKTRVGSRLKSNERIRIGFLIHDVSRLRRTAFDQRMKHLGITRSQWWVLIGMTLHGEEGIPQVELAGVLDLGKVALGGLIDRLEEGGFVQRRSDAQDRRVNLVYLTAKGNDVLEKMHKIGIEMNAKVMKGIDLNQQHHLAEMLHAMKTNLMDMDTVPGAKGRRTAAGGIQRPAHIKAAEAMPLKR